MSAMRFRALVFGAVLTLASTAAAQAEELQVLAAGLREAIEGQAHGGVVQGTGEALMERVVFDENGQYLTGSFMDYALRATDALHFQIDSHPVPAKTNPLGAKGCGEAGCAGSLPAVMNAVVNALSEYRIRHVDMPATPFRVWQEIWKARATLNADDD